MTVTLGNRWFTFSALKALMVPVAFACCLSDALAGRTFAATNNDLDAEYEEWGLEPPVRQKKPAIPSEPSKPRTQATGSPAKESVPAVDPAVPADLAARFGQAAVQVVVVLEDGRELQTIGWIVDKGRGIVMTNRHVVVGAVKLIVAYPQLPGAERGSVTGSPAVMMQWNSNQDIAYLQVSSPIPASLPALTLENQSGQPTVGGYPTSGFERTAGEQSSDPWADPQAPRNVNPGLSREPGNPLVGQWYLQDDVGDYNLTMMVRFDEQGNFRLDSIAVDESGSEDRSALVGSYTVRGSTLLLQTNEGPQQAQFMFEDGYLNVTMPDGVVTLTFERVELSRW